MEEATRVASIPLSNDSDFSSGVEEMVRIQRITLGDYGRLDNLEEVSLRFQTINRFTFYIKSSILTSLRDISFSRKD